MVVVLLFLLFVLLALSLPSFALKSSRGFTIVSLQCLMVLLNSFIFSSAGASMIYPSKVMDNNHI